MDDIIKTYLEAFKQTCPTITDEALAFFASGLFISELPPKIFVIKVGEMQKEMNYVYSGLIRAYFINEKGEDITTNFTDEKKYFVDYTALKENKPSRFYFQTIEPTILISTSKEHLQVCIDKYPEIDRYLRLMLEDFFSYTLRRLESFLLDNAETRYLNFINEYPTLYNRVPITQLCSYLGVERQSLTRIRKKLSKK